MYGLLSDYFSAVSVKRLSAVDADPNASNQHEIGTTREMREQFLGSKPQTFETVYVWFGRKQDGFRIEGSSSYYDARKDQPDRSPEWRLYYSSNDVTEAMQEGDSLFLARAHDKTLYFIVASAESVSEGNLSCLFALKPHDQSFKSRKVVKGEPELDITARFILDEIGIKYLIPDADHMNEIVAPFGVEFPKTKVFSQRARDTLPGIDPKRDPDSALIAWVTHEEKMYRQLEKNIVTKCFNKKFQGKEEIDVDTLFDLSLSSLNRRKARMGLCLENHLEAIFLSFGLSFDRGAITEGKQKPDFLFPGAKAYQRAASMGHPSLVMLGAKSTCKERWKQVLTEAKKISRKHLFTLDRGIPVSQTSLMEDSGLQLVVPRSSHHDYTPEQQIWLWSLADFIRHVQTTA